MVPWLPIAIGGSWLLNNLFGNKDPEYTQLDPKLTTPKYTSPDQMGIPQYLADGSVNPLWTFLSTGMQPGYTTTSNTGGFSNTKSTSTTKTDSSGKSVTSPEYFHGSQGVLDALVPMMKQRLLTGGKVSGAEQMGVINSIMRDAGASEQALLNTLSERGVAGSPVEAGARASLGQGITQALAGYRTQIPGIERARGLENENQVAQLLANLFKGSKTVFDSTTKSKTDSLAETTYGSSTENIMPPMFNPNALNFGVQQPTLVPKQDNNIFNAIGDLGSLAMLFQGMGLFGKGTNPLEFAGTQANQGIPMNLGTPGTGAIPWADMWNMQNPNNPWARLFMPAGGLTGGR